MMEFRLFAASAERLRLDFLIFDGLSMMSLAAAMEPLRAANRIAGKTLYEWRLLSIDGGAVRTSSGVTVNVDAEFAPNDVRDALILIASFHIRTHATRDLRAKIRRVSRRKVPLGAIEAAPFLLAAAGVADGHSITTHWEDLEEFEALFPNLQIKADRFVIDEPIFTSSGAAPTLDLMLELIRTRQGLAISLEVASAFIYDQAPSAETQQRRLSERQAFAADERIARCLRMMGEHVGAPVAISVLAQRSGASTRTLEILFHREFKQTPSAFYLALRLSSARRLVTDTKKSMTDIAIATGFASASAFSRAFKRSFGESPRAARGGDRRTEQRHKAVRDIVTHSSSSDHDETRRRRLDVLDET